MIQQQSLDGNGWAVFSDDMTMRFRLGRAVNPTDSLVYQEPAQLDFAGLDAHRAAFGRLHLGGRLGEAIYRVVFLMLNPSVADAFKPDRTVDRCIEFARRWGAQIVEVVNLFAYISTDPKGLLKFERWRRGDDEINDRAILAACKGASRVIAAWGNGGELGGRDQEIRQLLHRHGRGAIQLEALRFTKDGFPRHPLARGKSFMPYDTLPEAWPYAEMNGDLT